MKKLTPTQIKLCRDVKTALRRIKDLQTEIATIQAKCSHPRCRKEFGANVGNYDPSADCYWTNYYCPSCDKRWSVDGSVSEHYDRVKDPPYGYKIVYEMLTSDQLLNRCE